MNSIHFLAVPIEMNIFPFNQPIISPQLLGNDRGSKTKV